MIYDTNFLNQNCMIREYQEYMKTTSSTEIVWSGSCSTWPASSPLRVRASRTVGGSASLYFILNTLYFTLFFISGRFHFFHHLPQFYDCFDIWLEWQILFSGCSDCEFESLRFIIWKRSLCLLMAKMFQVRVSGEQSFWQIVLPHPFENLG